VSLHLERTLQQNSSTRTPQASVSAALSAARAEASARSAAVRFPGEDGGRSLAEMAQRDLDAALQLLADRAQYITGASGAAIALRRNGKNDMLCRASTGTNAPELGALLSTEFGLSGESVRTRQPLRCDDAERDARVNRDVCREMGIASVVVMPVVNDDEVLGVFELFSGKANAFGARDVSAVQRLSEMVETAVRLAHATESLPERLKAQQASTPDAKQADVLEDQALAGQILEDVVFEEPVLEEPVLEDSVLETSAPVVEAAVAKTALESAGPAAKVATEQGKLVAALEAAVQAKAEAARETPVPSPVEAKVPTSSAGSAQAPAQKVIAPVAPAVTKTAAATPKKPLFWSAALAPAADAGKAEEADQSHVPPVLRSLRKCEACGFPVSAGRVLCVECEEKKWRGQLNVPKAAPRPAVASGPVKVAAAAAKPEVRAFAAAAPSMVAGAAAAPAAAASSIAIAPKVEESEPDAKPVAAAPVSASFPETAVAPAAAEFVLSAGLAPSQSWIARNKYIVVALVVVGAVVAGIFLLR
jgi:GAF domain